MKTIKVTLLLLVIVSQVFYVKYVVLRRHKHLPDLPVSQPQPDVKPGQIWSYKCSLPFHESDEPTTKLVLAVTNDYVKYVWGFGATDSTSVTLFLADSTLVTNAVPDTNWSHLGVLAPNFTNKTAELGIHYDPTNHVETFVGLMLNFYRHWGVRGPITNTTPADKEYGFQLVTNQGEEQSVYALSCGNRISFGPGTTIPTTNVPCPCGNTNHWLWYFKSE